MSLVCEKLIFFFFVVVFMQGSFDNLDIVFGSDTTTNNSSSLWILNLYTQFSGLTTLQTLVTRETLQGG